MTTFDYLVNAGTLSHDAGTLSHDAGTLSHAAGLTLSHDAGTSSSMKGPKASKKRKKTLSKKTPTIHHRKKTPTIHHCKMGCGFKNQKKSIVDKHNGYLKPFDASKDNHNGVSYCVRKVKKDQLALAAR